MSFLGFSDGAEPIGFRTMEVNTFIKKVRDEAPTPFIALWKQEHFAIS